MSHRLSVKFTKTNSKPQNHEITVCYLDYILQKKTVQIIINSSPAAAKTIVPGLLYILGVVGLVAAVDVQL